MKQLILLGTVLFYTSKNLSAQGYLLRGFSDTIVVMLKKVYNGKKYENNRKYTFTYDKYGCLLSKLEEQWSDEWTNVFLETNTIDKNHVVTEELSQYWAGSSWENKYQYSKKWTYNKKGQRSSGTRKDFRKGAWENSWETTNTFNNFGKIEIELIQNYEPEGLINDELNTYTYDADGFLISKVHQRWHTSKNVWVNRQQDLYVNDKTGKITSHTTQQWNNEVWENESRLTLAYDAQSNLISETKEDWEDKWENSRKTIITYEKGNRPKKMEEKSWDGKGWKNSGQTTFTYQKRELVKTK